MKKVFSIIAAGALALLAVSCAKEQFAVFDISKATAPVLGSYQVGEDDITATYTPATFKMGFNEKIAPNHTLALVSIDGQKVSKTLTTSNKDGVLTLKNVTLAKALMLLGKSEGSTASVELAVRASMQEPSKDNGRNGYIDSEGHISLASFEVVIPEIIGSPYADYTEASTWGVTGSLSAYGISWDGDLNMWTDGNNHVACHVKLAAGDEFKFRKDAGWDVNFGGDFTELDSEFTVTQGGPNIVIGADGVYDLYLNPLDGSAWVTAAYDPLPDFTEASTWGVTGSLPAYGISWNSDLAMITDGTWHVALGVNLNANDEFKFRKDGGWDVNFGGDFAEMDTEFEVTQGGPNIVVGTAGCYDLYLNPDAAVAKVTEASGAKVSAKIGGGGEEPPVQVVTGWNIIGLNGDWENDVRATEDNGVWTAYITAEGDTEFKWRKDGGWDENYGGVMVALGEPFEAVAGGDNIQIGAGFWKVVLDTNNLTITVSNGQVWSLIGDFNEWSGDVDMTLTDGKWVSPVTKISGGFKIRENHGWDNNRGGVFVKIGEPFAAVAGGDNITVEEGNYVVTYDPEAETIVIDETGWGVVGTITGWGKTPDIILKEDGKFLVARNIALAADDEIKIRYKSDWDVNRGGRTAVGHAVKAEQNGANIKPGVAGNFDVWYRPDSEVLFVMPSGTLLSYWGVVGTINGWGNTPDRIMYETEDGKFVFEDLEIVATDEIKIRENEDWGNNRGGAFAALGDAFAVENNGPNIAVGRDAKVTVTYDPAAETITLTGEYQGDAPDFPDYIYAIGGDTDWTSVYPLFGKNGQYKGFGYLSQAFKFRPNEDNWDGDWECVGEGQIGQGSDNCPAPADAGYYMIEVDLNAMTYGITLISTIGIIGPAQAGGWDSDTDMTYNQAGGYWEAKGIALSAGDMKFRANDGWDINWGGSFDNLVQGGDNMAVEAGTYDVVLYALCDGKAYCTLTAASGDQPAAGVTIDGDMSDWADIEGITSADGPYYEFKAFNDDKNLYFYSKRNWHEGLWKEAWGGYYDFGLDKDRDQSTGGSRDDVNGLDIWMYLYLFTGTADAPTFPASPVGAGYPDDSVMAHAAAAGTTDKATLIETEVSIPLADLGLEKGQTIDLYTWGNKSATNFKATPLTYTVK